MRYELSLENVTRIVNSGMVPANDPDGIRFEHDSAEITITKPFINEEGKPGGNDIFIKRDDNLMLSFNIVAVEGTEHLLAFYKDIEEDKFLKLKEDSPRHVREFAEVIWVSLVNRVEEWESDHLLSPAEFRKGFGNHAVPPILEKLLEFQNEHGSFSEGFYLTVSEKTGLRSWSEDPGFLNAFIDFATANGTGSQYAFWALDQALDECPVVVFGDEGGVHIVAENIQQLLRLLTYDREIWVDLESAYFYKDETDDYESPANAEYLTWLAKHADLSPVTTNEEADAIIVSARDKHQLPLNVFLGKYGIEI